MQKEITPKDQEHLVFLALVRRIKSQPQDCTDIICHEISATAREFAMIEKGFALTDDNLYWQVIIKNEANSSLTLIAEHVLSPMRPCYSVLGEGDYKVELISWGVKALLAGFTGYKTCLLAGADFEFSIDVYDIFVTALAEHSIPYQSSEACYQWRETDLCIQFLVGNLKGHDALGKLNNLHHETNYENRYYLWNEIYETLHYHYNFSAQFTDLTNENLDEYLTREAERAVTTSGDRDQPMR